ncbi:labile enterotoxin output A [Helicobacter pylori]|nr:labile enterotoxin output A [Helicobacter pylori]
MNETLKQFKENQKRNQENLNKLLDFIKTGEKYGIKIEESFKAKINSAIQSATDQKLKVALVGGFSEGKTSIAAAWIERLDKSMKIDHQESSDAVKIYNIDNEIELVDTPGLFGFKEKIADSGKDSGKIECYKDITKKYVSEAHLILYALNPSNPIKESHKDDLNWLFRTLNLLSRTIFVISRFDEEADIEDEEDYNKRFKTKKENGGKLTIIEEAKKSVIQDVVYRQMPLAKKVQQNLKRELEYLNKAMEKRQKEIQSLNGEISQTRINLKEFITRYFSDLVRQVAGTSLETFNDFVIREIGNEGINIDTRVQNAFERETQGILNEIAKIETSFNADRSLFEKHAGTFGKIGNEFLTKSGFINATNIKLARDGVVAVGKFVGIDLAFKFKPWGTVKLAGNLNKALPFIGIAFEAWDSWNKYQKEQKLEEAKEKMVSHFDNQKKEILDLINDETRFKQKCFLSALELEKSFQEIKEAIEKTQEYD